MAVTNLPGPYQARAYADLTRFPAASPRKTRHHGGTMTTTTDLRPSVRATYDSRETGPAYHVTTFVGRRCIGFQQRVDDPFVELDEIRRGAS